MLTREAISLFDLCSSYFGYLTVIEICERLWTMGIAANLVTYLIGTMHLPSATSANIVTDFVGTSFMLCLLGGFFADSFLGRYKTIAIFSTIQALVSLSFNMWIAPCIRNLADERVSTDSMMRKYSSQGTALLAVSTKLPHLRPPPCQPPKRECRQASSSQMSILYLSLYLMVALGIGGLKSSVSGFGTEQFDSDDPKEKAQMAYFFNRFVFLISTGTMVAVTVLVYLQDEVGRSWAYGICSITMLGAILVFLSGTKRYRYKKSLGNPIVHIIQVLASALRKRNEKLPSNIGALYEDTPDSSRIQHSDQFRYSSSLSFPQLMNPATTFIFTTSWRRPDTTLNHTTQVLGPCGSCGGGWFLRRQRSIHAAQPLEAELSNESRGSEDGSEAAASVGDDHLILDDLCANDDVLCRASLHYGEDHQEILDPCWVNDRLLCCWYLDHISCLWPTDHALLEEVEREAG